MKAFSANIIPTETWATNFDVITQGAKVSGTKVDSYLDNGSGSYVDNSRLSATAEYNGQAQTGWSTSMNPSETYLNGSSGKAVLIVAGTNSSIPDLGDSSEFTANSSTDYILAKLYLNPKDSEATGSNKVQFTMDTASKYEYRDTSGSGSNVVFDTVSAFNTDNFTFDIII